MRKVSVLSGLMLSLMAVLAIGGCATTPPADDANVVIKDGMSKLVEVTSFTYEVNMNGDFKDPTSDDVKFDAKLAGAIDMKDTKDPKLSLSIVGSMDGGPEATGAVDAEMMLDKTAMYAQVSKLDFEGMDQLPPEVTEMFGKWYSVALPEGALDEFSNTLPAAGGTEMTEEQKQMKAAFEESKVFGNPEYVTTENVMGDSSYKYAVTVDKNGLADFLQKVAVIEGEPMTDADVAELKKGLQSIDVSGFVWVSVKSGIMNKFEGTINIASSEVSASSGVIALSVALGKMNEDVTLNIPQNAEEFPTELLFGAMMMGAMSDPTMMDPSMMDPSMMENGDAMMNLDDVNLGDYSEDELNDMMGDIDMSNIDPSMFEN